MTARVYVNKPVEVTAWRNPIEDGPTIERVDLARWCGGRVIGKRGEMIAIDTLEGTMYANPGDYIIRGVQGEFYPCKPDIFDQTYSPSDTDVSGSPTDTCPECRLSHPTLVDCALRIGGNCPA